MNIDSQSYNIFIFVEDYQRYNFNRPHYTVRTFEVTPDVKKHNIEILQEIANKNDVLVGVGDNDLHHLSQSRCCCGVDVINENFANYLKYNMTYMSTGDANLENFDDLWTPCSNCKRCFNSDTIKNKGKFVSFKEMVAEYIYKNDECIPSKYKYHIQKQLFNVVKKKLF